MRVPGIFCFSLPPCSPQTHVGSILISEKDLEVSPEKRGYGLIAKSHEPGGAATAEDGLEGSLVEWPISVILPHWRLAKWQHTKRIALSLCA